MARRVLGPILRQSLRSMWKRPLQPLLGLCAIAMGTAVVVGVDTANRSATLAFDEAVTTLGGSATHAIVGDALGIEEEWLPRLRTDLGVRSATPVVEGTGRLLIDGEPKDTLRLRGVDPLIEGQLRPWFDGQPGGSTISLTRLLLEPRAVVLSERTADRLGLGVDDERSSPREPVARTRTAAGPDEPTLDSESTRSASPSARQTVEELVRDAELAQRRGDLHRARALFRRAGARSGPTAEGAWIRLARLELNRGHSAAALRALRDRSRFGRGFFGAEAAWIEVQARSEEGDRAGARRAARRLVRRYQGTPQSEAAARWLEGSR